MKPLAVQFSWVLAVVFILVGILGFFPNPLVGEGAIFHTDMMHNIVHLASGVVALIVAMTSEKASIMYLYIFGAVYLLVTILGFMMLKGAESVSLLGLLEINAYDNWLHLVLGVVIFGMGIYTGNRSPMMKKM